MKKLLVVLVLLSFSLVLAGCGKKDNTEVENLVTADVDSCAANGWNLVNWVESWDADVCVFDDNSFCSLDGLDSWDCQKWAEFFENDVDNEESASDVNECEGLPQEIVCGEDWNTYFNKCYLDASWVKEEVELAHVENWECVFW